MKKSFILFKDSLDVLDELSDEQAGKLFKAIKEFQNGNEPDLDFGLKIAFVPFRNQFIRDNKDYFAFVEKQREKGIKSAESRRNKNKPRLATVNNSQPLSTYTDTVNDTVNDNVNEKENEIMGRLKPSHLSVFLFWLEYRKETKKKVTNLKSLSGLVSDFNKHTVECCEWVVNQSVTNGWQGLFWDKYVGNAKKNEVPTSQFGHESW